MVSKKTRARLLRALSQKGVTNTRIDGYWYTVEYRENQVTAIPHTGGSRAWSGFQPDHYAYTHGGETFRRAVQLCWELAEALRAKQAGKEVSLQ